MFLYLDDILIFFSDLKSCVQHVRAVLQRILKNQLYYCKAKTCEFHIMLTKFLNYVVSPRSVQMDGNKVNAVLDWPVPTSLLVWPDTFKQFIVGVNASEPGVGAVLSQRTSDSEVHP